MKYISYPCTHFIYEADNIPDHRSRHFGCCPCQMAFRGPDWTAKEKAMANAATSVTASAKLIHD